MLERSILLTPVRNKVENVNPREEETGASTCIQLLGCRGGSLFWSTVGGTCQTSLRACFHLLCTVMMDNTKLNLGLCL